MITYRTYIVKYHHCANYTKSPVITGLFVYGARISLLTKPCRALGASRELFSRKVSCFAKARPSELYFLSSTYESVMRCSFGSNIVTWKL
jgi:hypothetical protein